MEPAFHHWFPQNGAWAALKPPPNVLKNPHEPAFHPWVFPKRSLDSPKTTPNQKKKKSRKKKEFPKHPRKNASQDWPLSHMKCQLQCAEQQKSSSNVTKYCACHEKWLSWLIFVTYETPFTLRRATGLNLQSHQILPATKNDAAKFQRKLPKTGETSFAMRGRSEHDPGPIRAWSENDPSMSPAVRNPPRNRGYFSCSARAICLENCNTFALQLWFQISPSTAPATNRGSWTSPNSAPSAKSHT